MIDIQALAKVLSSTSPLDLSTQLSQYAAVALMIRMSAQGRAAIGYIKRASVPGDRWAGHVAFPGGKRETHDNTSVDTAVRETLEEIGVQLSHEAHLGRLTDLQARNQSGLLPFYIRPHVFTVYDEPVVKLDTSEVASFEWVDLGWFLDPANRRTFPLASSEGLRELPAFVMPDQSLLWGLTYMMTEEFLGLLVRHDLIDQLGGKTVSRRDS